MTDARKLAKLLLDAGYDDGFGVTSLDTLLCEQMTRDKRLDFARFLEGVAISNEWALISRSAGVTIADLRALAAAVKAAQGEGAAPQP